MNIEAGQCHVDMDPQQQPISRKFYPQEQEALPSSEPNGFSDLLHLMLMPANAQSRCLGVWQKAATTTSEVHQISNLQSLLLLLFLEETTPVKLPNHRQSVKPIRWAMLRRINIGVGSMETWASSIHFRASLPPPSHISPCSVAKLQCVFTGLSGLLCVVGPHLHLLGRVQLPSPGRDSLPLLAMLSVAVWKLH